MSEINGAGGTGGTDRCCGTTGVVFGFSGDIPRVEAPVACVTVVVADRDSPESGRFGEVVEFVEFEAGVVLVDAGVEFR